MRRTGDFTLVEIMIAVLIIALLVVVAIPSLLHADDAIFLAASSRIKGAAVIV
jgi:competence protein ComGC